MVRVGKLQSRAFQYCARATMSGVVCAASHPGPGKGGSVGSVEGHAADVLGAVVVGAAVGLAAVGAAVAGGMLTSVEAVAGAAAGGVYPGIGIADVAGAAGAAYPGAGVMAGPADG